MRLIKFSLVVMGVLILVGFAFVGYVSYQRMTGSGTFAKGPAKPDAGLALGIDPALLEHLALNGGPVTAALGLPAGARVEAIHDVGNRILLLIREPTLGDQLYLIEPRNGMVLSAIALGATAPTLPVAHAATPAPAAPAR